jgi:hypothetical protein
MDKKQILHHILLNKVLHNLINKENKNTECIRNGNAIQLKINDDVKVNEKMK